MASGTLTDLGETALSLASFGWPCFPCEPRGKRPCTKNGCKDATTDLKQIFRWWKRWPEANIGLATGAPGPGVLDFDLGKQDTAPVSEGYELLKVAGLLKGAGPIIRTRSGGWHLYFLGGQHENAKGIGGYPIDYRGVGGYVITAPSAIDPGVYTVINSRSATSEFDVEAARKLLTPPPKPSRDHVEPEFSDRSVNALVSFVEESERGERRPRVFWALCKAAENNVSQEPIIRTAIETLELDERDIRRQAANAKRLAGNG